jgi:hypothetical protein
VSLTRHSYMTRSRPLRRAPMRYKAPKPGSRRALRDELDSLMARFVKLRDGHQCQQCLADGVPSFTVIDAGHLYPKADYPAARWDTLNVFGQCRYHNLLHIGAPAWFMQWFLDVHGQAAKDALLLRATGPALTLQKMQDRAVELKRMVEELEWLAAASV